jgi:arsenate reductase
MTTLYGIKNCDTVKKARRWLDAAGVDYRFHDLRVDGLQREMLERWNRALGWELLLNRRGTTWRKLTEAVQAGISEARALDLMEEQPTLIKRPVVEHREKFMVGFREADYAALFRQ